MALTKVTGSGIGSVDGGVTIDNITIDGTEIDLSSGDLTIDVAGDISLDANGQQIFFKKDGTTFGQTSTEATPANFTFESTVSDGDIIFKGNDGGSGIEVMRIDMSEGGFVGIGKTSPLSRLHVANGNVLFENTTTNVNSTVHHYTNSVSGGAYRIRFDSNDTVVGSIGVGTSSTAFNTSSDYRLKENVVIDWDATTRLKQLKPSRFNFIADADTTVDGFLAHQVSDVVPEAITGTKDAVDEDGNPEYQGIDQSKLVPLLTKALQEAVAKIETLEARITALESK